MISHFLEIAFSSSSFAFISFVVQFWTDWMVEWSYQCHNISVDVAKEKQSNSNPNNTNRFHKMVASVSFLSFHSGFNSIIFFSLTSLEFWWRIKKETKKRFTSTIRFSIIITIQLFMASHYLIVCLPSHLLLERMHAVFKIFFL